MTVEINPVSERGDLRSGRDPKLRLDHAAEHHSEPQRPGGMGHAYRLAQPPGLGQLDVDPVGIVGRARDVAEVVTALVDDHGRPRLELAQTAEAFQVAGWERLLDQFNSEAYQYRLTLSTKKRSGSPEVRAVYVTASNSYRHGDFLGVSSSSQLLGKDLPVPQRSQMIYPNGGEVWCSPTSLSMVMAYWSSKTGNRNLNKAVPTVADGTYDYVYRGNGNWPFNTAYASTFGLKASINRFSSLGQVERWISKGVPVIVNLSWGSGQLDGAPIPASNGHLLVIRGFHSDGERIIVNDPAADGNSGVKRLYDRQQFAAAWFRGSGGIAYLVYPKGWNIPDRTSSRSSW